MHTHTLGSLRKIKAMDLLPRKMQCETCIVFHVNLEMYLEANDLQVGRKKQITKSYCRTL